MSRLAFVLALLSLAVLHSGVVNGQAPNCSAAANCRQCLDIAPACQWCSDLDERWQANSRCATTFGSMCTAVTNIQSRPPINVQNAPLGDTVQVSPQLVSVEMRARDTVTVNVELRPAADYPLDVYYLMDHSFSFNNDLDSLKSQANGIGRVIQGISRNFQVGFGSFVDKTVQPFILTQGKDVQIPCRNCKLPYSFENTFPLSNQSDAFRAAVNAQIISGNIDTAEGLFDAMMQVLVCGEKIGWRRDARRVLVVATDAVYHNAGDGRVAGVVLPNDGQCRLDANRRYSASTDYDYPSIGQLYNTILEENIFVVFAVAADAINEFGFVRNYIQGSTLETLSAGSENLQGLLARELASLIAEARPQVVTQEGVRVTSITAQCPNPAFDTLPISPAISGCRNLVVGARVQFQVNIEASSCEALRGSGRAVVRFVGFGDVVINVTGLCDCPCDNVPEVANATWCNNQGAEQCGQCSCLPGFRDATPLTRCDCDTANFLPCIQNGSGLVCSDRGECVCQQCQCETLSTGKYCECNNGDCARGTNGQLCSGNGQCTCGTCVCNDGFSGESCECASSSVPCESPDGRICNGQGVCECGICECLSGYAGRLCDRCERTLSGCQIEVCPRSEFCLELLDVNNTMSFEEFIVDNPSYAPCGGYPTQLTEPIASLPHHIRGIPATVCTGTDRENCVVTYYVVVNAARSALERDYLPLDIDVRRECPDSGPRATTSFNYLPLVLGIVFGLLFAGILMLLIWRIYTWRKDQQEYNKFLKAQKSTTWSKDQNPLFKAPTQEFNNPTYGS